MATTVRQQADGEHFLQRRCSEVTPHASGLHTSMQVESHSFLQKAPGSCTVDFSEVAITCEAASKSTHPHWRSPHRVCDTHIDQVGCTELASDVAPPCTPLLLLSRQKYGIATSTPGSSHSLPFLSLRTGLSDTEKQPEGKPSSFNQTPYGTPDEFFISSRSTQPSLALSRYFSQSCMEGQRFGHESFKDCCLSLSRHEEHLQQIEYSSQTFPFSHYSGHPLSHRIFASPGLSKLPDMPPSSEQVNLNQRDGVSNAELYEANQAVGLGIGTCGNNLKVGNVGERPTCADDDAVWPKNMKFMQLLTGGFDHLSDDVDKGRSYLDDYVNKDLSMADGFGPKSGFGDGLSYLTGDDYTLSPPIGYKNGMVDEKGRYSVAHSIKICKEEPDVQIEFNETSRTGHHKEVLSSNCNQDEQESDDFSNRAATNASSYSTAVAFSTMAGFMNAANAQMPKVLATLSGGDHSLPLAVGLSGSKISDAALETSNLHVAEDAGWGKFLALSAIPTRKVFQAPMLPFQLRFEKLQAFLKQCDESDVNHHIHVLRMLTAAAKSNHAADLENRARQLALEEGREMKRMRLLNVLRRGSRIIEGSSTIPHVL